MAEVEVEAEVVAAFQREEEGEAVEAAEAAEAAEVAAF